MTQLNNRFTAALFALFLACPVFAGRAPIFEITEEQEQQLREEEEKKRQAEKEFEAEGPSPDEADQPGAAEQPRPMPTAEPQSPAGEVPFWSQGFREIKTLEYMLTAEAWHYRVFGLMRLERFQGETVAGCIVRAMDDPAWQVRCFALRAAARNDVQVPEGKFDLEPEARVIRMAQRVGVPVALEQVRRIAGKEMRSRTPERVVLGIEIAARSGDEKLLKTAKGRLSDLLMKMNSAVLVTVGDRLAELMQVPAMSSVSAWQHRLKNQGGGLSFPEFEPINDAIKGQPIAPIAEMGGEDFLHTVDYLDTMHTQDLQIGVIIDGTGSMGHVIHRAQGQTNRLMLTLNDLAKSMEMGVIIYRDEGDDPMLEAVQMTDKLSKVRGFLFKVEAKGGGDFPEAVYEALYAARKLDWSSKAVKQAVLIADAPAHEENLAEIKNTATALKKSGVTVNTLIIGSNPETKKTLEHVAKWGGGEMMPLAQGDDLAKLVFHLVIDEKMHTTFDHLYDLYVEMGL